MLQGILILVFLLTIMALMIARKLPTVLALFILAIGICVIAGIPPMGVNAEGEQIGFFQNVIQAGAVRLGDAIMTAIFAGWLGMIMEKTNISKTMIKKGAELGGDKTLAIAIILFTISSLLFTVIVGLGSVIMVGTITIPILISVGVDKETAAGTLLFSYCVGMTSSLYAVNTYSGITSTSFDTVFSFSVVLSVLSFVAGCIYLVVRIKVKGRKFAFSAPLNVADDDEIYKIKGFSGAMAMLTPLVPILLVAVAKFPLIPGFMIGIIWACVFTSYRTSWKRTMDLLTKTFYDGFSVTAPAATLTIAIGMLIMTVNQTAVQDSFGPLVTSVTPTTPIAFILLFALLAPLCLYRGPFNLWGLGAGIAALMVSMGVLPVNVVMGGFVGVTIMQTLCCPTNTQNVWAASFVGVEVFDLTKRQILYIWPVVLIGIVYAGIRFF